MDQHPPQARDSDSAEGPMVPLDPPSPDTTYDYRRARAERMERKRARYLRPQPPGNTPIPRHILDSILQDPASMITTYSVEFRSLILEYCLHYGIATFYESWSCGHEDEEGNPQDDNPPEMQIAACRFTITKMTASLGSVTIIT